MKKLYVVLFLFLVTPILVTSQENLIRPIDGLPQIMEGNYEGTFLNDPLVADLLTEYLFEAENRGLDLQTSIDEITWILVEPDSNQPFQLTGMNLGMIDRGRKMVLLSRSCLIDRYVLKATLYRELSHYLGIPYNKEGLEIMALEKPKGYSYAWFVDYDIRQNVYDDLFTALKQVNKN